METSHQEAISNLCAVTGLEPDIARLLLKNNGWQLEFCVNEFLSKGDDSWTPYMDQLYDKPSESMMTSSKTSVSSSSSARPTSSRVGAREIQAPPPSSSSSAPRAPGGAYEGASGSAVDMDDDGVRAPINFGRGVLMADDQFGQVMGPGGPSYSRYQRAHRPGGTVFETGFRDFRAEGELLQSQLTSGGRPTMRTDGAEAEEYQKRNRLAELFRPPLELLFNGSLDAARDAAKKNFKNNKEFGSQRLNRDTWKNEMVQDIIKEFFVFIQIYTETPDGAKFTAYYKVQTGAPFIAILDPRTGELVRSWKQFIDADKFHNDLVMFLGEHSLGDAETVQDREAQVQRQRQRAQSKAEASHLIAEASANAAVDSDSESGAGNGGCNLTEDEQLSLAIAQSLQETAQRQLSAVESPGKGKAGGNDSSAANAASPVAHASTSAQGSGGSGLLPAVSASGDSPATPSSPKRQKQGTSASDTAMEISSANPPELTSEGIAASDCALRVRWRGAPPASAGFRADDRLSDVYAHVASLLGHNRFKLVSNMPRTVHSDLNQTLKEAGLVGRVALEAEMTE